VAGYSPHLVLNTQLPVGSILGSQSLFSFIYFECPTSCYLGNMCQFIIEYPTPYAQHSITSQFYGPWFCYSCRWVQCSNLC